MTDSYGDCGARVKSQKDTYLRVYSCGAQTRFTKVGAQGNNQGLERLMATSSHARCFRRAGTTLGNRVVAIRCAANPEFTASSAALNPNGITLLRDVLVTAHWLCRLSRLSQGELSRDVFQQLFFILSSKCIDFR